jgi:pSer/pThr/pTyr-binding forkhead associated (FHA) protein
MPKLTLSFKGHVIDVFHLEKDETCIGRDEGCDIYIDSLAIAPRHALIRQHNEDEYQLEALDQAFPVQVNRQQTDVTPCHTGTSFR